MNRNSNFISSASVILALVVFFASLMAWKYGQSYAGVDFYQFWVVSQAIAESDVNNIYSNEFRRETGSEFLQKSYKKDASKRQLMAARFRQVLETYSTPFLYTLFRFIVSGNYEVDLHRYHVFSLLCILLAIIGLCRLLHYSSIATMAAILIFIVWFEPFFSDLRVANVNMLQVGLLALFLWFQSRHQWRAHHFIGGLVLGFAMMFKPNLIFVVGLLVISWTINRRYRKLILECAGILLASISAFAYSSFFFGSVWCWTDWIAAVSAIPDDIMTVSMGNFAPVKLILDWTGISIPVYATILIAVLVQIFVMVIKRPEKEIFGREGKGMRQRERAFFEDALVVASGCLTYLLCAQLVWLHYFLLTIPMILIVFRPFDQSRSLTTFEVFLRRILPAAAVTSLAVNPVGNLFMISNIRYIALIVVVSTLSLFGLGLWELWNLGNRSQQENA
jgi:hypothetical protein